MSLKYGFLSVLTFCVCLFAFFKNYEVWTRPLEQTPEKSVEKKTEQKPKAPPPMEVQKDPDSIRSYIFIAEKNIFSPDRKDFPIVTVNKSNPATRPQVILYGVTIAGDYQAASITSPGRAIRKGERETVTLKQGEQIGGYKLAKIQPDRITMESNGDSFEVLLYDSRNPKKRMEVKTEVKLAMVTTTQPAPAPPTRPAAAPATAPPPAPVEKAPPAATVAKPKEPPQQQVVPTLSTPTARPIPPPFWQRRMGILASPPTSPSTGVPGKATQ